MHNRSRSARRHGRWLVVAPAVAAAAVAMTACSAAGEQPAPADATYSTPAVWTGKPAPSTAVETGEDAPGAAEAAGAGVHSTPNKDVDGFVATLGDNDGNEVGTASLGDTDGAMSVSINTAGGALAGGIYQVGISSNGACEAADGFQSAGDIRHFGAGEGPTTLSLPIADNGSGTLTTEIPGADVQKLLEDQGSSVVLLSGQDQQRVACGVVSRG